MEDIEMTDKIKEEAAEETIEEIAEETTEEASEESAEEITSAGAEETETPETPAEELTPEELAAAIEAVLFAAGNSVKREQLREALGVDEELLDRALDELKLRYMEEDRGIMLAELEDALQLCTKSRYYGYLMKLAKKPVKYSLSDTVIETLSIIAYKQPVTKMQIENIRGVSSDHAVNKLLEYDLVKELGRLDAPGHPILFGTTEEFLRAFGVSSISDLPELNMEKMESFREEAEEEANEKLSDNLDVPV